MSQGKTLIHFHIGRTAGTTLRMILRRNFPEDAYYYMNIGVNPQCVDEFRHLPEKKRGEIRYLDGHMPFGLHKYLPHSSTYITLLRDPVDRVISEYYFVIENPNHPVHDEVISKNMSLPDYVRSNLSGSGVSNVQTRCLSGELWGDLLNGSPLTSSNILEIAKANLREYFLLVGLSERFDESLILLKRALGWKTKDILYFKQNVGGNRSPKDEITSDTLKLIESYNQLDIELYPWAKKMFEERIGHQGSSFRRELRTFQLCNKIYGLIMNNMRVASLLALVKLLLAWLRGEVQFSYVYDKVLDKVKAVTRKQR